VHSCILLLFKHLNMCYNTAMKLIAQVKLEPTIEQAQSLEQTMRQVNAACNYISDVAWHERVFGRRTLRDKVYRDVREAFDLGAQIAQHAAFKVADAYKKDKKTKREFRALGSVTYDLRILSWATDKQLVSIWTVDGRLKIPFVLGEHQRKLLESAQGEADLIWRQGEFYIHQTCDIDEPEPSDPDGWLGVDMGVANIAVDSDKTVHQGKTVKSVRYRHRELRRKLQAKGTHSARRRLRKLSGKEQRFAKWTNHNISKAIVAKAVDTGRGIALEDLGGIRDRITVRRPQRAALSSWSFAQLRTFIEYKAKLMGVVVAAVDPRNTSRACPCCGHSDKANRKTQDKFLCVDCGFSGLADHIAAVNISRRASVNTPYIPDATAGSS
jgi:putative transposase